MIFDYAYAWCSFCYELGEECDFVIQEYDEHHPEECPGCKITLDVEAITLNSFGLYKAEGVEEI